MKISIFYLRRPSDSDIAACPILQKMFKGDYDQLDLCMYGYTDDMQLADIFENVRDSSIIIRRDKKISRRDFNEMNEDYNVRRLRIAQHDNDKCTLSYKFDINIKSFLVITEYELDYINDDLFCLVEEELCNNCYTPYYIFKDEYMISLDTILYSLFYEICYGDTSQSDMCDYDFSYGITPMGKRGIGYGMDYIFSFISLFKPLLNKDEFK